MGDTHRGTALREGSAFWIAAALGMVAGMRTMTPPAVVSRELFRRRLTGGRNGSDGFLATSRTANVFAALALAEWVVDKLPGTPERTSPPALLVRAVSGALTAISLASRRKLPTFPSAAAGALGAIAGAHLFMQLRQRMVARTGLPDAAVGAAEDLAAVTFAALLAQRI